MGDLGVKDNANSMAIEPAVVTTKANKTSIGFFGRADSSHQFLDTMLGYGSGNYGGQLQQPPMMAGKARVPSSDLNNSFVIKRKSTRKGLHHHKTIDHNQTTSSIAQNISFTHEPKIGVRKSTKVHAGRFSGRNSFLAGKQSPIMTKVISPKVRSILIDQNGSHIDDGQLAEQQKIAVAPAFIKMTEDLNNASGDVICSDDYTLRATQDFSNLMNKNRVQAKNRMTSFTIGSNSDVSTTVMAPSNAVTRLTRKNHPSSSAAHNFAELGAGLVNDTPRSKLSMDNRHMERIG